MLNLLITLFVSLSLSLLSQELILIRTNPYSNHPVAQIAPENDKAEGMRARSPRALHDTVAGNLFRRATLFRTGNRYGTSSRP